jgi:8-oxo-dGTP pyrophosphatase MutT (NUDIX family)
MKGEQSGVIPFRYNGARYEVLLITSIRRGVWIVPKGHREPGMTSQESAVMEAFEEAGVRGEILPDAIGVYEYTRHGVARTVEVYLLHVSEILEQWPEARERKRLWVPLEDAREMVADVGLQEILQKAETCLALVPSGRWQSLPHQ